MKIDVAVIGGGIAGLWCLSALKRAGYNAHLFENAFLGAGQTIACQGILHSGAKYGEADPIRVALAAVQPRWQKCLAGAGEVDLSSVQVLSEQMAHDTAGDVKQYDERVLEVRSLIAAFQKHLSKYIHLGQPVDSHLIVHASGFGNGVRAESRRRPLRMFLLRPAPYACYTHFYTSNGTKPELTITTHPWNDEQVWMLGGGLAEQTTNCFSDAVKQLKRSVGLSDISNAQLAEFLIDRAEPRSSSAEIQSEPQLTKLGRTAVAWPIKLTLAPMLADKVLQWVAESGLRPTSTTEISDRSRPQIARYPWELARWNPASSPLT